MRIDGQHYRTIWVDQDDGWTVGIIDQTRLPHVFETKALRTAGDAVRAIKDMLVRGAPHCCKEGCIFMKKLILLLPLLVAFYSPVRADPSPRPIPWIKVNEWYVSALQVRMWGPDTLSDPQPWTGTYVRINVSDPYPEPELQSGQWYEVDLTPFGVAEDATAAFMSGILLVTSGQVEENRSIRITFARTNDSSADCSKYIGQSITKDWEVRDNMATFVPLNRGKFKFCFESSTEGEWPENSAYGVNLTLQAWGR